MTQRAETIFLSAGVPDPRTALFAATADPVAIGAAVSALIFVTMGRRRLVWGGQPAITAMVRVAAEDMGVEFGSWVRLYQSDYFEDDFPEENAAFSNVTYTPKVDGDRNASLMRMRERIFSEVDFGRQGALEFENFLDVAAALKDSKLSNSAIFPLMRPRRSYGTATSARCIFKA